MAHRLFSPDLTISGLNETSTLYSETETETGEELSWEHGDDPDLCNQYINGGCALLILKIKDCKHALLNCNENITECFNSNFGNPTVPRQIPPKLQRYRKSCDRWINSCISDFQFGMDSCLKGSIFDIFHRLFRDPNPKSNQHESLHRFIAHQRQQQRVMKRFNISSEEIQLSDMLYDAPFDPQDTNFERAKLTFISAEFIPSSADFISKKCTKSFALTFGTRLKHVLCSKSGSICIWLFNNENKTTQVNELEVSSDELQNTQIFVSVPHDEYGKNRPQFCYKGVTTLSILLEQNEILHGKTEYTLNFDINHSDQAHLTASINLTVSIDCRTATPFIGRKQIRCTQNVLQHTQHFSPINHFASNSN
jgi:hypothetical protein